MRLVVLGVALVLCVTMPAIAWNDGQAKVKITR
jgi:hypothetical protein